MNKAVLAIGILAGAGALVFVNGAMGARRREAQDVQIDPNFGIHRGLAPTYGGMDATPTRMPSAQDPKGGPADYLGYNYAGSQPSVYAKGEPAQKHGSHSDKREDNWAVVQQAPIDYGAPPVRIPKLWKDANRYWDGFQSYGGVEVMGQRLHLFHLRPSSPTRGYRSISGSLAPIGGGQSTASRLRIPAIFVPSVVS